MRLRGIFPALGAIGAAAACVYAVDSRNEPAPIFGTVPDFKLVDSAGRSVRRADIKGPWIADFMFTRCPVQCPMTTARLNALSGRLPGISLVSFSLDPSDTPKVLARYAQARGARWLFLTGRKGEVKRLAIDGFKLPVLGADGGPSSSIVHSKKLVLIDAAGRVRGYFDSDDEDALERLSLQARRLLTTAAGS